MRPDVLAAHLAQTIRTLHTPLTLQVAELEATGGRVAIALDTVTASLGDLGLRLATLEAREPIPGPPGPPGPPGLPGVDGQDGVPGRLLDTYKNHYVSGTTYDAGDTLTDDGSLFLCKKMTTARPGTSPDWKLIVKRGRDGKDLR